MINTKTVWSQDKIDFYCKFFKKVVVERLNCLVVIWKVNIASFSLLEDELFMKGIVSARGVFPVSF